MVKDFFFLGAAPVEIRGAAEREGAGRAACGRGAGRIGAAGIGRAWGDGIRAPASVRIIWRYAVLPEGWAAGPRRFGCGAFIGTDCIGIAP